MESLLPNGKVLPFLKFCRKNRIDISSSIDTMIAIEQFKGNIPL